MLQHSISLSNGHMTLKLSLSKESRALKTKIEWKRGRKVKGICKYFTECFYVLFYFAWYQKFKKIFSE